MTETLTAANRQIRMNVRNFLLVATADELQKELDISIDRDDLVRAGFIREMMVEEGIFETVDLIQINKDNWTGEEASVRGWFNKENKTIEFDLLGTPWMLTFMTWRDLDGSPVDEDTIRLIGSGGWVFGALPTPEGDFGKPTLFDNGPNDCRRPFDILADAARWVWKHV